MNRQVLSLKANPDHIVSAATFLGQHPHGSKPEPADGLEDGVGSVVEKGHRHEIPADGLSLRWRDVDWERGRRMIPSPKTQPFARRSCRVIPLFPAIRPYLEAAFDEALGGAEHVMPEEYRRRAQGPGGWRNANLRTTLAKVVRRAGLKPWPRFWHSMRASCETGLAREFPLAIEAKWRGNTQAVAMRHYVDVTDPDFERAT